MNAENIMMPARDNEHERVIGIIFDIPPQQAAIVSCLARGAVATTRQLWGYLGSKSPPKIAMSHVRQRLRDEGLEIKSKLNVGYWMEEPTIEEINKRVDAFLEGR